MSQFSALYFVKVLRLAPKSKVRGDGMYLTPAQLVERWKGAVVLQSLANWRSKKKGPPYVKMGTKVLYPLDKLEAWEAEQLRNIGANDNNEAGAKNAAG